MLLHILFSFFIFYFLFFIFYFLFFFYVKNNKNCNSIFMYNNIYVQNIIFIINILNNRMIFLLIYTND